MCSFVGRGDCLFLPFKHGAILQRRPARIKQEGYYPEGSNGGWDTAAIFFGACYIYPLFGQSREDYTVACRSGRNGNDANRSMDSEVMVKGKYPDDPASLDFTPEQMTALEEAVPARGGTSGRTSPSGRLR